MNDPILYGFVVDRKERQANLAQALPQYRWKLAWRAIVTSASLSSAIATSMTVVMGYASIRWFEKGEKLSQKSMKEISKKLTMNILDSFKKVFHKKPGKKAMQQAVETALEELDLAKRETMDQTLNEVEQ